MNTHFSRCLLTIEAEDDAQAPTRILGLLTRRNMLPDWFSVRRTGNALLRIVLEVRDHNLEESGLLAKRIANIPSVISVSRALMDRRAEVVP